MSNFPVLKVTANNRVNNSLPSLFAQKPTNALKLVDSHHGLVSVTTHALVVVVQRTPAAPLDPFRISRDLSRELE